MYRVMYRLSVLTDLCIYIHIYIHVSIYQRLDMKWFGVALCGVKWDKIMKGSLCVCVCVSSSLSEGYYRYVRFWNWFRFWCGVETNGKLRGHTINRKRVSLYSFILSLYSLYILLFNFRLGKSTAIRRIGVRETSGSRHHGDKLRTPLERLWPLQHTIVFGGLKGALNLYPIMPISRTADVNFFSPFYFLNISFKFTFKLKTFLWA